MFIGLSPDLQNMEQIRRIMRPTDVPDTGGYSSTIIPIDNTGRLDISIIINMIVFISIVSPHFLI